MCASTRLWENTPLKLDNVHGYQAALLLLGIVLIVLFDKKEDVLDGLC